MGNKVFISAVVAAGFFAAHLSAATETTGNSGTEGFATDENAVSGDVAALISKFTAEPQDPTGKFTTAVEIRPMLDASRASWMGVREYEGRDLVYFSHLLAMRCGLVGVFYAINDDALKEWPLPPCHFDLGWPNSILAQDGLIFAPYPLKSVDTISVTVVYDDLTTDSVRYERNEIKIP